VILVFAGQENSPTMPGMHHLIGTCDTQQEAMQGFEMWCSAERAGWYATLSRVHPVPQAQEIAKRARFWYQLAEHRPGQDPEYVIVAESGRSGTTYGADAELHYARQALLAFNRGEMQGQDGDEGQARAEFQAAEEFTNKWQVEFAKSKELGHG
jgi:hypothetical protein